MASIYLGRNAAINFEQESAWGEAEGPAWTNSRPLISGSLTRTITKTPRPSLRSGSASAMRLGHVVEADECGGGFSVECTYENIGLLLFTLMGTVSGSTPGPWTYTFASALPSLTMEFVRGSGLGEILEGVKLNSGTFAVSAGGVMTFDADVIAETSAARATATAPSYGSGDTPVLHSHAGQFNFNSVNYDLVDFSLAVNNGLARRQLLGSTVTKEPLRSDFQSVELSVTVEVEDALYAAFLADTQGDATITFTSGSLSMAFTIQNVYLSEASDPISDAGVVQMSLSFVAESDGSDEGLAIVVTNAVSGDGKTN